MHDQPTPTVIQRDAQTDSAILMVLLCEDSHRPWSVDEIAREMGSDPSDSLRRLYGGGLIHRLNGFVWASRAAALADELDL
jgi:hypothetical protein